MVRSRRSGLQLPAILGAVTVSVAPHRVVRYTRPMKLAAVVRGWFARGPSRAEKQLLRRCSGDASQAERLIRHELARRPQLSRAAASQAALDRWARDR